ncbi:MAG: O-antigen ligase family protein [Desulfomonilia bacterium]
MNTLVPAINFIFVMILFGSLMKYHNQKIVLSGTFFGFIVAAMYYTISYGFPFVIPEKFSYNAVALMYLSGLFVILVMVNYARSKNMLIIISFFLAMLILATTSIKTNLGIVSGVVSGIIFSARMKSIRSKMLIKRFLSQSTVACMAILIFFLIIVSSNTLNERIHDGIKRVSIGVKILETQENVQGYGSVELRTEWAEQGLSGWMNNPIFGHGVEAFRYDFGKTSHATPVDLLYNFGLIGFLLFYSIFISIVRRLFLLRKLSHGYIPSLIFGTLVCFFIITLAGTMYYNSSLAFFIAVSVALISSKTMQLSIPKNKGFL